uniref:Pectinesterase n=1 Tax=Brassica oleracea var. oleracea TaxID=109376 RepID=A0A0D3BWK1_BRAOL
MKQGGRGRVVAGEGEGWKHGRQGGNRRVETLRRPPEAENREAESRRGSRRGKRKERKKDSLNGDKCAFYSVGFSEVQDTLWDADGRHFFHRCTIQGAVDFIFGNGQSIYKVRYTLTIHITLQENNGLLREKIVGRTNPYDASGFVFTDYLVHRTGKAFLGRPWCSYARVIFYNADLSDVVVPKVGTHGTLRAMYLSWRLQRLDAMGVDQIRGDV